MAEKGNDRGNKQERKEKMRSGIWNGILSMLGNPAIQAFARDVASRIPDESFFRSAGFRTILNGLSGFLEGEFGGTGFLGALGEKSTDVLESLSEELGDQAVQKVQRDVKAVIPGIPPTILNSFAKEAWQKIHGATDADIPRVQARLTLELATLRALYKEPSSLTKHLTSREELHKIFGVISGLLAETGSAVDGAAGKAADGLHTLNTFLRNRRAARQEGVSQ